MLLPSLSQRRNPVPDFDFVLFGATGDLAARKLLPALLQRESEGVLPAEWRIICTGQQPLGTEEFLSQAFREIEDPGKGCVGALSEAHPAMPRSTQLTGKASPRLPHCWLTIRRARVLSRDRSTPVRAHLRQPGGIGPVTPETRVVLEKPIGHDLQSSGEINDCVEAACSARIRSIA